MNGTTPICRCRVLYLGSSVPHVTKDGLQGIQEPLRDLYPDKGGSVAAKGIDSWLSVWSNGLLLENVDEQKRQVTRFFPIDTLHYCAAVRFVLVPGTSGDKVQRFLPLDSPFARNPNFKHPPVFACILRRTSGIKVLECHAFICKKESAANALVRCCFHAFADSIYVRQLEDTTTYNGVGPRTQSTLVAGTVPTLNTLQKVEEWQQRDDDDETNGRLSPDSATGSENYKVWSGPSQTEKETIYYDYGGTLKSVKSTNGGTSTLGNSDKTAARQRQRQVTSPPPALPPPNSIVTKMNNKDTESKSGTQKSRKSKSGKRPKVFMNGNGHMHSLPRHPPPPRHPMMMVRGPPPPRGVFYRHPMPNHPNAIYNAPHRIMVPDPRRMPPPPPHDPRFIIQPPFPEYGTITKHGKKASEEPIYMPQSARPISPVASYQPGAFNHEQYYQQQQYGTAPKSEAQYKKKKGKSSKNSDVESPFNTGIYKKKGHLNERAFSYSIRQEHRSRSNSLSDLKYFAENGEMPPGPENNNVIDKKDKELAQLVSGLEIKQNGHDHHHQQQDNFIRKKNPAFNGSSDPRHHHH